MAASQDHIIPSQEKGNTVDVSRSVKLDTLSEARILFSIAKKRLLDVSHWDDICGGVSAVFTLTDRQGNKINSLAKPGDYLRIDIPGPGSKTGDGYDWVRVEAIDTIGNKGSSTEELAMKVRPAPNPAKPKEETAHFFKNDATSTFLVKRENNVLKAEVHGRNELPNIRQRNKLDSLRNILIAIGAMIGFANSQWKKLVKGLIRTS